MHTSIDLFCHAVKFWKLTLRKCITISHKNVVMKRKIFACQVCVWRSKYIQIYSQVSVSWSKSLGFFRHSPLGVPVDSYNMHKNLPPSVAMSQNTLKGFPLLSGSIQYSPFPVESPTFAMCLQDFAAFVETDPNKAMVINKNNIQLGDRWSEFLD